MGSAELVVASNRGPLSVASVNGEDSIQRGGGGLVSGMQSALVASGNAVWVCAALNDRERTLARDADGGRLSKIETVAEELNGEFEVRMLPIDALTFRQAYNGIANSTLWFVLHMLYDPSRTPVLDLAWRRQWAGYQRYNRAFAQALADEAGHGSRVLVQDYHLFLVPKMLREMRPDLRIAHFTHTPWVVPDALRALPDEVVRELLEGVAAADIIGFHTPRWANLFADCCLDLIHVDTTSRLHAFPLATDATEIGARAHERDCEAALRSFNRQVGDRLVIGRVDRTELSKNVLRGLLAYRQLLRSRPEWRGRVVHAVFDYPSREDLPEYRIYVADIERLGVAINEEFETDDWTPLIMQIEEDYAGSLATLRRTDVVFVNSVRDGMNLVVLEGIVLSERDPAVVLSRETGAADVLGDDAILINPFDVTATAEALHAALTMPMHERAERAARLRQAAVGLPPAQWFQAQLDVLG